MSRILISGAGIAGLTAALWFERQGHEPVVIERASKPRGGGYLVSLSHYAFQAAQQLGVLELLKLRDMGIRHSSYHNMNGDTLLALDYRRLFKGVDVLQIMRDDVVDVLYQQAQTKISFRFDEKISAIDQSNDKAHVEFESGTSDSFDMVVVAEGQNSTTRSLLLGDEVHLDYLGLQCAAMKIPNHFSLQDKFETHMDLGRYMAMFNTPDGDLGTVFVWSTEHHQPPPSDQRQHVIEEAFRGSGPVIQKALSSAKPDSIYLDSLKQVIAPRWQSGRCVLIGDAAHCLTLFSGRGAAAAIAGATRLAHHVDKNGIEQGLLSFEAESRRIVDPIQKQTRGAVRWYVPQNQRDRWLRDNGMRWLPNRVFEQYFKVKYSNV